jgi:hypothetical protein
MQLLTHTTDRLEAAELKLDAEVPTGQPASPCQHEEVISALKEELHGAIDCLKGKTDELVSRPPTTPMYQANSVQEIARATTSESDAALEQLKIVHEKVQHDLDEARSSRDENARQLVRCSVLSDRHQSHHL